MPTISRDADNELSDILGDGDLDTDGIQSLDHYRAVELGAAAVTDVPELVADTDADTVVVGGGARVLLAKYDSNDQLNGNLTADNRSGGLTTITFKDDLFTSNKRAV